MDPRDEAANAAMQALLPFKLMSKMQAKMQVQDTDSGDVIPTAMTMKATGEVDYDDIAHESYAMADAMMRARETRADLKSQMDELLAAARDP